MVAEPTQSCLSTIYSLFQAQSLLSSSGWVVKVHATHNNQKMSAELYIVQSISSCTSAFPRVGVGRSVITRFKAKSVQLDWTGTGTGTELGSKLFGANVSKYIISEG